MMILKCAIPLKILFYTSYEELSTDSPLADTDDHLLIVASKSF